MAPRTLRPGHSDKPVTDPPRAAVAEAARNCPLPSRARALAAFVGDGEPVTAKGVLRRTDLPTACAAVGLTDPGRVVSAAHVPALHRAWTAAHGAGLITVGNKDARAGATGDGPIDQWRHAVAAVLRAECGAIDPMSRTVTALGQWARPTFAEPPAPRVAWADTDVLELRIDRPTCVGGRGDAPVEDWPDDEPPARPLDLAELDGRPAKLWA